MGIELWPDGDHRGVAAELANATIDGIEIFHNRQRRHCARGYCTPIEHEVLHNPVPA